ncbi:hypothetical protein MJL33_35160, partial [Salmonella enterica subsp. enterica serovar Kentucky]|nr:hypothetical protein [Salmonella enterica subsp. enterica serovar Kentucky]
QNYDKWYEFGSEQEIKLADLDVILMRKDPPFDTEFIYATYILSEDKEHRYIETLYGQGYRFNRPVVVVSPPAPQPTTHTLAI